MNQNKKTDGNENPPTVLYKYRDWSKPYNKKLLTHRELYFASALEFNDPYDFAIPFRYDESSISIEAARKKARGMLKERGGLTGDELELAVNERMKTFVITPETIAQMNANADQFKNDLQAKYGIVSLCENYNDILMWSHYGADHKGFCIGLDSIGLFSFLEDKFGLGTHLLKMNYCKELPTIDFSSDKFIDRVNKIFLTKFEKWIYENEWRIISKDIVKEPLVLPDHLFESIYFGCNFDNDELIAQVKYCKEEFPAMKIYHLEKDEKEFKLNRIRLN